MVKRRLSSEFLQFHAERQMFIMTDIGTIVLAEPGIQKGHEKWAASIGIDAMTFPRLIRGYIHPTAGVCFYKGQDFSTDENLERLIPHLVMTIDWLLGETLDKSLRVSAGCNKGAEGDIWPPLKTFGTVGEILENA